MSSSKFLNVSLKTILAISLLAVTGCEEKAEDVENVELLKQNLTELATNSNNVLFQSHFESIKQVIEAEKIINPEEAELLNRMYDAFSEDTLANPSDVESYLNRERTLILAWTSPTDGKTSFSWLRLPKDWNPEKEYPLYVHLHGYWDVAAEPISYMSFTFNAFPSSTIAFEDGYWLSPWGRGNEWYQGISKTDIWEAIEELERKVNIDDSRKYLSGHSMGGFGTWNIAQESYDNWAAIGMHSAALFYDNSKLVSEDYAIQLKDVPSYFVWGNNEDEIFHTSNNEAIRLLEEAGNQNIEVTMFEGGHDYNESDVEAMYNWMKTFRKN